MVFQRAAKRRKAVAYALPSSFSLFCQLISDFCIYILNQVTGTSMADIKNEEGYEDDLSDESLFKKHLIEMQRRVEPRKSRE